MTHAWSCRNWATSLPLGKILVKAVCGPVESLVNDWPLYARSAAEVPPRRARGGNPARAAGRLLSVPRPPPVSRPPLPPPPPPFGAVWQLEYVRCLARESSEAELSALLRPALAECASELMASGRKLVHTAITSEELSAKFVQAPPPAPPALSSAPPERLS